MFDKVSVKAGVDEEKQTCTIYINWSWVIKPGTAEAPSCRVFCCGVEQDRLINQYLFRKKEILNWFDKEVVNFSSPNYDNIFKLYFQNPSNMGNCYYNTVSFHNGDSVTCQRPLSFSYEAKNKIFLICVYDGEKFEQEVVAVNNAAELSYKIETPKKLFGLIGDDTPMLKEIEGDSRRKVLIVKRGGKTTYSMIPKGYEEFYISKELADGGNIQIKYLTDFI